MMMSRRSTKWGSEDSPAAPPSPESVHGRALALLTQREHARGELAAKLAAWGAGVVVINETLDALAERGLQDDSRFAEAFVRSRRQRGYGPQVIAQELKQRGIDSELIQSQLYQGEYDWQAEASAVRRRRFGPAIPQDRKEQARQLRFLQYRGFSSAQAMAAVRYSEAEEGL